MAQRKLFLGARVKRLRRERGLNQSQMADELGISASYLNHLERNQRPVTAGILLRLAEIFRASVIDASTEHFVFEITGRSSKIDQFIAIMMELGLAEVSRTGIAAIARGTKGM